MSAKLDFTSSSKIQIVQPTQKASAVKATRAAPTGKVTRTELPSAPKPKAKKGMSIAVSSCSRSKRKPVFEEDPTDAMDLFGSMGLGSAMDAALRSDKDKTSSLFSTSKQTATQTSRLTATADVSDDDSDDESDGGGWGDDDGWNDSGDDLLSD